MSSIYDNPENLLDIEQLEETLYQALKGKSLANMPPRTRSKKGKELICLALGCEVPNSFKKCTPRFPVQKLNVAFQSSQNLQIWNQDIEDDVRFALIHLNGDDVIDDVRVVLGSQIKSWDKTKTDTIKYQAAFPAELQDRSLQYKTDTSKVSALCAIEKVSLGGSKPTDSPRNGSLFSLQLLSEKLQRLIGKKFQSPKRSQDRSRGDILHKSVCELLGYNYFEDNGQFPDLPNQLLEIKLQTSPTIDLGKCLPSSSENTRIPSPDGGVFLHKDVRYLVCYAKMLGDSEFIVTSIVLVAGEYFFSVFNQLMGKTVNKKKQIIIPSDLFKRAENGY